MIKYINYVILILFLFSCSTLNRSTTNPYRALASEATENCHDALEHFKSISDYYVAGSSIWRSYAKYTVDEIYSKKIRWEQRRARWWQKLGGRERSKKQRLISKTNVRMHKLFVIKTANGVVRQNIAEQIALDVKPIFEEVEKSFFLLKNAFDRKKSLEVLYVATKDELEKSRISKKILAEDDIIIEEGINISRHFTEYKTTREFLERVAREGSDDSQKAKEALDKLSLKRVLNGCPDCGDPQSLSRPRINTIENMIMNIRPVQIYYRTEIVKSEALQTAITYLPVRFIASFFDRVLAKLPVIKSSDLREMIRQQFLDIIFVEKFYHHYEDLVLSGATDDEILQIFMDQYAKANSREFLLIMARRVDTSDVWGRIYDKLVEKAETSSDVQYTRIKEEMEDAIQGARQMSLMSSSQTTGQMTARFVAGLIISMYLSTYTDDVYDGIVEYGTLTTNWLVETVYEDDFDDTDDFAGDDVVDGDSDLVEDDPEFSGDDFDDTEGGDIYAGGDLSGEIIDRILRSIVPREEITEEEFRRILDRFVLASTLASGLVLKEQAPGTNHSYETEIVIRIKKIKEERGEPFDINDLPVD